MAEWLLADVMLHMRESEDDSWTSDPASWAVAAGDSLFFRMAFRIANGDEEIPLTEMQLQHRIDGGEWQDTPNGYAKNQMPGYQEGGEFGEVHAPTWFYGTVEMDSDWSGSLVEFRAEVNWPSTGWSQHHSVTVLYDMEQTGDLWEYFRSEDHGVEVSIFGAQPRRILGIFDDPGRRALRIQGHRPSLLVEYALVDSVVAGDSLELVGSSRTFTVRGKRRSTDLAVLVLEETTA